MPGKFKGQSLGLCQVNVPLHLLPTKVERDQIRTCLVGRGSLSGWVKVTSTKSELILVISFEDGVQPC